MKKIRLCMLTFVILLCMSGLSGCNFQKQEEINELAPYPHLAIIAKTDATSDIDHDIECMLEAISRDEIYDSLSDGILFFRSYKGCDDFSCQNSDHTLYFQKNI